MMEILVIIVLVAASFCGTGLIYWAIKQSARQREALKALATKRGWQFEYSASSGGRGTETRISDPSEGWVMRLYFHSSSTSASGGGRTTRWTQFEAPDLAIDGMAVLGPDIPEKTKQMADCQCRSKIPQKCRSNFPHFRDLVTSQIRGLS
jgi:hypothetical protein